MLYNLCKAVRYRDREQRSKVIFYTNAFLICSSERKYLNNKILTDFYLLLNKLKVFLLSVLETLWIVNFVLFDERGFHKILITDCL